MRILSRMISRFSNTCPYAGLPQSLRAFNIRREQLQPTTIQTRHYHPWITKAIESITGIKPTTPQETKQAMIKIGLEWITGMKMLSAEETKQAIIDH